MEKRRTNAKRRIAFALFSATEETALRKIAQKRALRLSQLLSVIMRGRK